MGIPKLTISIATYNRPESLKNQALSLIPQLTDQVLLVIRDNKSNYDINDIFTKEQLVRFEYYNKLLFRTIDNIVCRC